MKKKVIVIISGGIGNQLFMYATARRLALANDAELVLDMVTGFENDYVYKRKFNLNHFNISGRLANSNERLTPFSRLLRRLIRWWNTHKSYRSRTYIREEAKGFDCRLIDFQIKSTLFLEGYWQSEKYFKDVESFIRSDLQIIPPNDLLNSHYYDKVNSCNSVALSVRFFDHPSATTRPNNLTSDYYIAAILQIEKAIPDAHYFIFSEYPEEARMLIPRDDDRVTIISHNTSENAYADLWLMSKCKNFIIANSTFAWWGAWLSAHDNKIICCPDPSRLKNKSWHSDMIPDKWIKV